MKTYLYKPGTILTCILNEGCEGLLTVGKKYQCTESKFEASIKDFVITVIADNGLYYTFSKRVFEDREVMNNLVTNRIMDSYKGDPEVFVKNIQQIVNHGEHVLGLDIAIWYLEQNLNRLREKRAAQFNMFDNPKKV